MKFAAVVGSAKLPQFVELNVRSLRKAIPDIDIIIDDDHSHASKSVEEIATRNNCEFITSSVSRGHFAGDAQCAITGLAYGKHVGADVVLKISQRFIVVSPNVRKMIEDRMTANPNLQVMIPGKPLESRIVGHKGFAKFDCLTDFIVMRNVEPDWLLERYRDQVRQAKSATATVIEVFWKHLLGTHFKDRHEIFRELTDHGNPSGPFDYLRRYQNTEHHYVTLGRSLGLFNAFPLGEWSQLLGRDRYRPVPVLV